MPPTPGRHPMEIPAPDTVDVDDVRSEVHRRRVGCQPHIDLADGIAAGHRRHHANAIPQRPLRPRGLHHKTGDPAGLLDSR